MISLVFSIAFAQAPTIDTVQPVTTRAGFLRFDDDRFADEAGLDSIAQRLSVSTDPGERAALAEWYARVARQIDATPRAVQLALATPHIEVRRTVAEALQRAPEAQVRPLHTLADDPDPAVRVAALQLVARSTAADRDDRLIAALSDADPTVRVGALRNLRGLGVQASVVGMLDDPSTEVRVQAALFLQRYQPRAFAEKRAVLQADPDPRVRKLAQ